MLEERAVLVSRKRVPTEKGGKKRDPSRVPFIKAKPSLDELTDGEVVHHQKRGAKKC